MRAGLLFSPRIEEKVAPAWEMWEAERGTAAALLRRSERLLWELTHQSPGSSTLRLPTGACPAPPHWQGPQSTNQYLHLPVG